MRVAIIAGLLALVACVSTHTIQTDGPPVLQYTVRVGTMWALRDSGASNELAATIGTYLVEAKKIIEDGSAPASALDDLANYLNSHITNDLVKMAIQQGIEFIKANVYIPIAGVIPPNVKVWVYAVLDGAAAGCQDYINRPAMQSSVPVRTVKPVTISFR